MERFCLSGLLVALATACVAAFASAQGATPVVSMPTRMAPPDADATAAPAILEAAPLAVIPTLLAPTSAEGVTARSASDGRDIISFGREPARLGIESRIRVEAGQNAIRVRVTSSKAKSLRTAWMFSDAADYSVTVIGGLGAPRLLTNRSTQPGEQTWSAVTAGDTQEVVIRRLGDAVVDWSVQLVRVAHFDREISPASTDITPKILGTSAYCQSDVACLLDAADTVDPDLRPAILQMTRAVPLMILTTATGATGLCTGTLLNSANYPAPLLITAQHCTEGAVALDTLWFFSRANCGYGLPTGVQGTGGAATVWESKLLDSALLLLLQPPPSGASYAGWNAGTVANGTQGIAVHHPKGDVKKASFGTVKEIYPGPLLIGTVTYPGSTFYSVDWDLGIVEPGSSGSGFFTLNTNPFSFRLRATLTGGNVTCSGIASRTYYSRLDNIYPFISGPLSVPIAPQTLTAVEYYHAGFDHYFMTTIADEVTKLDNGTFAGWTRTSLSFKVYALNHSGSSNVCRFFSTAFGAKSSHFYTPSAIECNTVKANPKWQFEDLVFSFDTPSASGACATGMAPLYRLYNNGQGAAPNHRYTTSTSTRQTMINKGWIPEGSGSAGVIGCVPL